MGPPVQVEDDMVAEAWRGDEEAAMPQCSGRRWWKLPVAVGSSLSIGLGLGRWGTVAATNLVSSATVPTSSIYGTA